MLAIVNGKVLTAAGKDYERGTVLVDGGKILAVGACGEIEVPSDAEILDVSGKWVTPGLIDAHTHISAFGEPRSRTGNYDVNEITTPITSSLRGIDALNPFDAAIEKVRSTGFTTCYTGPGSSNVIGGVGIAFKLKRACSVYDMVIPGTEQMKMALGENPKFVYGNQKKYPSSRMSIAAALRQELYDAQAYSRELLASEENAQAKPPKPNFKLDPLVPVVRGERRCRIHCHRADDIVTAIRIAEEFGLDISIEHCTEGYKIADLLAAKGYTCVVGPLNMDMSKEEVWGCSLKTPEILYRAGVNICLTQDSCSGTRWLPSIVGMCIARGLPYDAALDALTINPARLLGIENRTGSIEAGKDADLAVFSGDPFCNYTICEYTVIDGTVYPCAEEVGI